jgi:hypothetical protein
MQISGKNRKIDSASFKIIRPILLAGIAISPDVRVGDQGLTQWAPTSRLEEERIASKLSAPHGNKLTT